MNSQNKPPYILWFNKIDKDDIGQVGGKGANLGEMTKIGIPVPPGFIVTTQAYYYFLKENNLKPKIKQILTITNPKRPESYQEAAEKIQKLILHSPIPGDLAIQIMKAYLKLGKRIKKPLVAIRSSATAEDLPEASFAGQQRTFLNIKGEANVVNKVRACWASLFEGRGIFYREEHNFSHMKVGIAVPVQTMVQSKVSGVTFTADPTGQKNNIILIEAAWGLGDLLVQGEIIPDCYIVDSKTGKIISREINPQKIHLIKKGKKTKKTLVPQYLIKKPKLTDREIKKLAKLCQKIHQHYFFPQDIEWAKEKNKLYIVQTRPITTINKKSKIRSQKIHPRLAEALPRAGKPILIGIPASPGIGVGPAKKIKSAKEIRKIKKAIF